MASAPAFAEFQALGSTVVVGVTAPERLAELVERVRTALGAVDGALSRFRVDSELRRLEEHPGRPAQVSPLFLEVLELACRAAESTGGWFDPTVRDAVEAAGYDRSIEDIERDGPGPPRPTAGAGRWRRISFDRAAGLVTLPEGVRLDFGGIGKGFGVDYALRGLANPGCGVLVSAGGDLAVAGPPPDAGWYCEVAATPDTPAETALLLRRGALATSGLGRRQWWRDGERLHHLIDPRTGRPGASPWRTVTVAAASCVAAEVAAKVAWLRGEAGPDWLAALGLAGRFSDGAGRVRTVGGWPGSGAGG
jgi:thiamine biosynthesis lipoprotein